MLKRVLMKRDGWVECFVFRMVGCCSKMWIRCGGGRDIYCKDMGMVFSYCVGLCKGGD